MKTNLLKNLASAVAVLGMVAAAEATPTLTLTDGNGHSTSVTASGGVASFNGALGDWTINVTTGLVDGTATSPYIDLNTIDRYAGTGGAGHVLTISWTVDGLGPLADTLNSEVGGTISGGISDTFTVWVNGVKLITQGSAASVFALANSALASGGANSTVMIQETLTATGAGTTSFDHQLTVPDGGTTMILLGSALSGLALIRRKLV